MSVSGGSAAAASKKGGKGGKSGPAGGLQLDAEWVVEHAAMVERLLPGGGCPLPPPCCIGATRARACQQLVL